MLVGPGFIPTSAPSLWQVAPATLVGVALLYLALADWHPGSGYPVRILWVVPRIYFVGLGTTGALHRATGVEPPGWARGLVLYVTLAVWVALSILTWRERSRRSGPGAQ